MSETKGFVSVPSAKPQASGILTFGKDWPTGVGQLVPERIIHTESAKVPEHDFIIACSMTGADNVGKLWAVLASNFQAFCLANNVKPWITQDGQEIVNPELAAGIRPAKAWKLVPLADFLANNEEPEQPKANKPPKVEK